MKKCKKTLRKLHSLEKILDYAQEELKLAEGKGYGSLIKTRQEVMQRMIEYLSKRKCIIDPVETACKKQLARYEEKMRLYGINKEIKEKLVAHFFSMICFYIKKEKGKFDEVYF